MSELIEIIPPIPEDIEALLRMERAIPDVPHDVARALWTKLAKSDAVTGGLGGASLLLIGGFVASVLGGSAWLLGPHVVRVTERESRSESHESARSTSRSGTTSPSPASSPSPLAVTWPSWFGQKDLAWRSISGRVVRDGRPVAGADVLLTSVAAMDEEHVRSTSRTARSRSRRVPRGATRSRPR